MKIIIRNDGSLNMIKAMDEVTRIMKKGFVVAGHRYQARTIVDGSVIECVKNKESYTFTINGL